MHLEYSTFRKRGKCSVPSSENKSVLFTINQKVYTVSCQNLLQSDQRSEIHILDNDWFIQYVYEKIHV